MAITIRIIALLLAITIAYFIGLNGKKRLIGFKWAFYFGLLMPLVGLVMTLLSNRKDKPIKRITIFAKVIAIIFFIYGTLLIRGGITTSQQGDFKYQKEDMFERYLKEIGDVQTGSSNADIFVNELISRCSGVMGGGILSLTLPSTDSSFANHIARRYYRINMGILLISIGVFLLRNKKISPSKPEN